MRTHTINTKPIWIALSVAAASLVMAQEGDPYTKANANAKPVAKGEPLNHHPVNIEVRYETFSLSLSEAAALSREVLSPMFVAAGLVLLGGERLAKRESEERITADRERLLDQHILMLRKKIEPDAAHPTIIETVRGIGYRFRGEP